ncbi:hypothetical protein BJ165DRAFT_1406321 [Panaeolus papilionaceus]|nr:hypothetical protein BJ165DRAFT_1406321 [Panaeolus papilionaceus]
MASDGAQGRLQVINGTLFYSPNDQRTLATVPKEDPTGDNTAGLLLPTTNQAQTEGFKERFEAVHTPRWWSLAWGWTAFIPIKPAYKKGLAYLNGNPTRQAYHHGRRGGYTMSATRSERYAMLEDDLDQMVHLLSMQLQISVIKPARPSIFGFKKRQDTYQSFQDAAYNSRDWFDVWVGLLCHLISETEQEQMRRRGFPTLALMGWKDALVEGGISRVTVEAIGNERVCMFDECVRRVGTFLVLENPKIHNAEVFVKRLERLGVPVWYRWLPEYEYNRFFQMLGPAAHQVQGLLARNIIYGPQEMQQGIGRSREQQSKEPQEWMEFWAAREEKNRVQERVESNQQREARLKRTKQQPVTSAKVYIWEEGMDGRYEKRLVGKRYRGDTLADYREHEKRYDPFVNEWHVCDALPLREGSELWGNEYTDDEMGSDGEVGWEIKSQNEEYDRYPSREEFDDTENALVATGCAQLTPASPQYGGIPVAGTGFALALEDMDDINAITNMSWAGGTSNLDVAEEFMTKVLRIHYGYTPPLPIAPHEEVPTKTQNRFLRFVGMPLDVIDRSIFSRPLVVCLSSFMERLGSTNGSLNVDEADYFRENRQSLMFNERMQTLRVINDKKAGILYMFDRKEQGTVAWKIAMLSAREALLVCRLPKEWDENEIALYLVSHGIPFKTLQDTKTLKRMPLLTTSTRLIPKRGNGHRFTADDYFAYVDLLDDFLQHRRGRAALMQGGFTWRVASSVISADKVLDGPTGWSTNSEDIFVVQIPDTEEEYVDDGISEIEEELICGLVECSTGIGDQMSRRSYYPLPKTYRGSGIDYGRWTEGLEKLYKGRKEKYLTTEQQPRTMTEWRDAMRGAGEQRRAQIKNEEMSKIFIDWYMSENQAK